MIKFYIIWLQKCCHIRKDRLKIRVGINESYKNKVEEIESYWSHELSIPKIQFQNHFFRKYNGKNSMITLKTIMALYGFVYQKALTC